MTTNSVSAVPAANPKRYHPALIGLHWLIAIMIFAAFFFAQENEGEGERFRPGEGNLPPAGFQQGAPPANFQPGSPPPGGFPRQDAAQGVLSTIGIHMIFGVTVLVLLVIRLLVRWRTQRPDWASTGNRFFDWVGNLTHLGLYILTFAMAITGILLANQRGILARVFGVGSAVAPGSFLRGGFRVGMLHGATWTLLLLLILLHVGAALYHQFILKDNLLGRMWFGRSTD